jgi:hypothetical protein
MPNPILTPPHQRTSLTVYAADIFKCSRQNAIPAASYSCAVAKGGWNFELVVSKVIVAIE